MLDVDVTRPRSCIGEECKPVGICDNVKYSISQTHFASLEKSLLPAFKLPLYQLFQLFLIQVQLSITKIARLNLMSNYILSQRERMHQVAAIVTMPCSTLPPAAAPPFSRSALNGRLRRTLGCFLFGRFFLLRLFSASEILKVVVASLRPFQGRSAYLSSVAQPRPSPFKSLPPFSLPLSICPVPRLIPC